VRNLTVVLSIWVAAVSANAQQADRAKLKPQARDGHISGAIRYLGRPLAGAQVMAISYLDKSCFKRVAHTVPLDSEAEVKHPKPLSPREGDTMSECRGIPARAKSDEKGSFLLAVPDKRWYLVVISWGNLPEDSKPVQECKIGTWRLEVHGPEEHLHDKFFAEVQNGPFFLDEHGARELKLELKQTVGMEGRCRNF
jgi:hypothetical protein